MIIDKLQPSAFRYGNRDAEIPFKVFMSDNLLLQWLIDHNITGYCEKPLYGEQKNYVAVMFNLEDHGEYWSHIPQRVFDRLLAA